MTILHDILDQMAAATAHSGEPSVLLLHPAEWAEFSAETELAANTTHVRFGIFTVANELSWYQTHNI